MFRDVASCNTYNYGDALYWDARYVQEADSFDWYQRYSALRPFIRNYVANSSRVLMVGCGNAVISEDMVKDGYEDIMNIDISSVAIELMRTKYEHIPQLKYLQMDVRDMSFFSDDTFDCVIDKGTLDSLMITYGDPTARMPHLMLPAYNWKITLYIIPKPGFLSKTGNSSKKPLEPVPTTEKGLLLPDYVIEDPDSHFIYVCKIMDKTATIIEHYANLSV